MYPGNGRDKIWTWVHLNPGSEHFSNVGRLGQQGGNADVRSTPALALQDTPTAKEFLLPQWGSGSAFPFLSVPAFLFSYLFLHLSLPLRLSLSLPSPDLSEQWLGAAERASSWGYSRSLIRAHWELGVVVVIANHPVRPQPQQFPGPLLGCSLPRVIV